MIFLNYMNQLLYKLTQDSEKRKNEDGYFDVIKNKGKNIQLDYSNTKKLRNDLVDFINSLGYKQQDIVLMKDGKMPIDVLMETNHPVEVGMELIEYIDSNLMDWKNYNFRDLTINGNTKDVTALFALCQAGLAFVSGIYKDTSKGTSFYVMPLRSGGWSFYYNPYFLITASVISALDMVLDTIEEEFVRQQLFFLACHEMEHVIYMHSNEAYAKKFGTGRLQNIILDSYINDEIARITNIPVPDSAYRGDLGYFRFYKDKNGIAGGLELIDKMDVASENQSKYVYTYFNNINIKTVDKLADYILTLLGAIGWIKLTKNDLQEPPESPPASDVEVFIRKITNELDDKLTNMAKARGLQGKEIDDLINQVADFLGGV